MSTRATILIKESSRTKYVYHHCDGYPEGIGSDMQSYLNTLEDKDWTIDHILNDMLSGHVLLDNGYEDNESIHGDEEFVYVIDCLEKKIHCYIHHWDDYESCIKPENEVEIE